MILVSDFTFMGKMQFAALQVKLLIWLLSRNGVSILFLIDDALDQPPFILEKFN